MSARRKYSGYQLLELLVVLAIMAFLAAILFPVFSKVREKARRSACQYNLKQLGLALQQYTQDWDDWTPPLQTMHDDNSTLQAWPDMIYPYIKNESIYNCPSNSNGKLFEYSLDRQVSGGTQFGSYNASGAYATLTARPWSLIRDVRSTLPKMADVADPSETVFLTDGYPGRYNMSYTAVGTSAQPMLYPTSTLKSCPRILGRADMVGNGVVERHGGTANVLFADGHVKAMRVEKLMETGSNPKPSYANPQKYLRYFTIEDD